ncbi:MAG: AAA family ATPase [Pseudomonadota bacterium]
MFERYLKEQTQNDLEKKMVFIGGPRQVGKTTFALGLIENKKGYLNWDVPKDREKILKQELPDLNFLILDEIHKFKNWRNFLKGLFDKGYENKKYLIAGSAKLDYYRYSGDSLQGRYHYLRMFPLSFKELKMQNTADLLSLIELGGFPEPFFASSKIDSKRWSREYRTRLINEELNKLENIKDLSNLELLSIRLPELVGSPLSINSITTDIPVSNKTLANWINILERLYSIFRISPFGAPKIRAVKKEQKHYHFDWTLIKENGLRFENLVAVTLLKWVCFMQDSLGEEYELRYFRDIDGREVDFVILHDFKPIMFIETKWNDNEISKGLKYLKERFKDVKAFQVSAIGKKDYVSKQDIRVCPANIFLNEFI